MREVGPVRWQRSGDEATVDVYMLTARTQLGIMKQQMEQLGLQQLVRKVTYDDGTVITCMSIHGQDQIAIAAPTPSEQVGEVTSKEEFPAVFESLFTLTDSNNFARMLGAAINAQGIQFTVAVSGGQLVVLAGAQDQFRLWADAIARAIKRSDFSIAENLLNSIDKSRDPNSNNFLDGALLCDEGFLVDPAIYAGQPYESEVLRVTSDYQEAFTHNPPMPQPVWTVPTDYNAFVLPGFAYHNRFVTYATPDPPADFTDVSKKTFLQYTSLQGQSGSLNTATARSPHTNPAFGVGFDNLPVGTKIYQEWWQRTQLQQSGRTTRNYSYVLYLQQEYFWRNYYTVNFNSGLNFTAAPEQAPGFSSFQDGPQDGVSRGQVVRMKARRAPSGWIVLSTTTVPRTAILPFSVGWTEAFSPSNAFYISPPGASDVTIGAEENPDGVQANYSTRIWRATDVTSFSTIPFGATVGLTVFPQSPSGSGAVSPFGPRAFFNKAASVDLPVSLTSDEHIRERFRATRTVDGVVQQLQFTLGSTGHVKVTVNGAATPETDVAPTTPTDWVPPAGVAFPSTNDQAFTVENVSWTQPRNTATRSAFYAGCHFDVQLEYYNPRRGAQGPDDLVPPVVGGSISCIYHPKTGHYMYWRLKDLSLAGQIAFAQLQISYWFKLGGHNFGTETRSGGELLKAILDAVYILANHGISTQLLALAQAGGVASCIL